jgi:hypothetical protein
MKLWTVVLGTTLLCATGSSVAFIGKVTEQLNAISSIQRQKDSLQAVKGAGIEMNDAIKTTQGKVGITFEDDTKVQITENSKLIIDDFVYDPKSKSGGKLAVKIALGTARYASGQIAKTNPQQVAISTPTATIGVRGTDFTATVDELGRSLVILLPSCPEHVKNKPHDIERDCVTGEISVTSDMGTVILNKPFQATRVDSRNAPPTRPVILNLSEDAISNMLIISPPKEAKVESRGRGSEFRSYLDIDFLKEKGLENVLEMQRRDFWQDRLSREFLDTSFIGNFFDMISNALSEDFLKEADTVLPDYKKSSGIVAIKDDLTVGLCRDDGSNIQCVTTPITQNSVIFQTQNNVEFKNRINQGGNTTITLIQK